METVTKLLDLPGGAEVAGLMRANPGAITGAVATRDNMVVVYGPGCACTSLPAVLAALQAPATHVWTGSAGAGVRAGSRTAKALDLVEAGATPHSAARSLGLDPAAVYRALQRGRRRCECCGRALPAR